MSQPATNVTATHRRAAHVIQRRIEASLEKSLREAGITRPIKAMWTGLEEYLAVMFPLPADNEGKP